MIEDNAKYIQEHQLTSLMNKTKWRELATSMTSSKDFEPTTRVKCLREKDPPPGFTFLDWEWIKYGESSCIEWLEIDPVKRERRGRLIEDKKTDFSSFVEQELKKHNIPFSMINNCFKVWGYLKSTDKPNFV